MKKMPKSVFICSLIVVVIGTLFNAMLPAIIVFVALCTAIIIGHINKRNPLFEKVNYQITLHQLNLDTLKGIPETLVNVKKLDKIVCKTINQGSTELYLIIFNPYIGEPCDCLLFTNKFDQRVKFEELSEKLNAK